MDKLRKRCIAALCAYMDARGIYCGNKVEYAKSLACRAAKTDDFNKITSAHLHGIIHYFNKERQALTGSRAASRHEEDIMLGYKLDRLPFSEA